MAEPDGAPPRGTQAVPLSALATAAGGRLEGPDVVVSDVVHRSDDVPAGAVFAAVPGQLTDGHDHAAAAVAAGAAALLVERSLPLDVPQVIVADSRAAMALAAAACWGQPSRSLEVVGVTGTNGKTTVVSLLGVIWEALGQPSRLVGTLTGTRTTPESTDLQARLAAFVAEGVRMVAMEVSSHALALHRVDGVRFAAAAFTNLGRDHLDFHGTMERYFAAKAQLFEPERAARAVLNVDDPYGRLLRDAARPGLDVVPYSLGDAADLHLDAAGSRFRWRGHPVRLPLVGRHNVANALAAATVATALGADAADVAAALGGATPPPGRFEVVPGDQPFLVVVDYAHTPDGLARVLEAARELATGRVHVVFGAGGDRDRDKRPAMGEVAARLADEVVLTTDNPRSEDPSAIMADVRRGVTGGSVREVADRAEAIGTALAGALTGDVVVIAGKGHETTQVVGDDVRPFDDRVVAAAALEHLGWRT